MNFLGHSLFSKTSPLFLLGNVCGDFYKGRVDTLHLPEEVIEGIRFHRSLDSLTDSTEAFREAREKLSDYGLYSGIIVDIFYDHFLSLLWEEVSDTSLRKHCEYTYSVLEDHRDLIPEKSLSIIDHMREEDWFSSYRELPFIEKTLKRISRRISKDIDLSHSVRVLEGDYSFFKGNFYKFIREINSHIKF